MLALVWAILDKFRYYISGTKVEIITDNSAVSLITKKNNFQNLVKDGYLD